MSRRCLQRVHRIALFAACLLAAPLASLAAPEVKDLGTLGGRFTVLSDINAFGQVTGYSEMSDGSIHAFIYADDAMQDLGTLGGPGSLATAINDAGQVTGFALTAEGEAHAFLYTAGSMTDLGPIGASSSGKAINASGQIAGQATPTGAQRYALVYALGGMNPFGQLLPNSSSEAISAVGQVAGTYQDSSGGSHAFLYDGQSAIDLMPGYTSFVFGTRSMNALGTVTGSFLTGQTMHGFVSANGQASDIGSLGGDYTVPTAINASGSITGVSAGLDGSQHAFLYSGGALQDVGTLGGTFSVGYALNAANQVAGQSMTASGQLHAFATQSGSLIDLGALVETLTPGSVIDSVSLGITDQGHVIGHYTVSTPSDLQMPTQTRSFMAILNPADSGVPALLEELLQLSTGVGPGKSLAHKVGDIIHAYSKSDVGKSCSGLRAYQHELAAREGKKKKVLDQTASLLNQKVATIELLMGCAQ